MSTAPSANPVPPPHPNYKTWRSVSGDVLEGHVIQQKLHKIKQLCKPVDLNHLYYQNKVEAIKILKYILKHSSVDDFQTSELMFLLNSSLILVYYFGMKLKLNKIAGKKCICFLGRQFAKTEEILHTILESLYPAHSELSIMTTLDFFSSTSLWIFESFVTQVLELLLYHNNGGTNLFNLMLTDIHREALIDLKSARHRTRVLYELLKSKNWVAQDTQLLPFVTRLLDFIARNVKCSQMSYFCLKRGFEVCLRRIFERVDNNKRLTIITTILNWLPMVRVSNENLLDISSLLEYVAQLYQVKRFKESFPEEFFSHILKKLVGSKNSLYSFCGCRLLARCLDRHNNATYLLVPTIYYEFSYIPLETGQYDLTDKEFVHRHREIFHDYIIQAIEMFYTKQANIESIYFLLSCLVIEVPCGLTAASITCIAMYIQDFAITSDIPERCRFWLHAVVLAVMSLVCWVHKAPELYRYVNEIISRRAKDAPQLNPPLQNSYMEENERVNWKKDTLYFEDWELRYGLWKHFKNSQKSVPNNRKENNRPTMEMH